MFQHIDRPEAPRTRLRSASLAAVLAAAATVAPVAHAAAQTPNVETAVRVMAVDGATGALTVIDPGNGEVVGRFTTPTGGFTAVYPSSSGRYLLTNHYQGDQVTIVDSGLSLKDHGDHADLATSEPFVRATVPIGPAPAHYWAHDGVLAIHTDGDGRITLIDERSLDQGVETTRFLVAQPDHSSIATLGEAMLVGYSALGRIDAYSLEGDVLQADIIGCPGAHGEARFGDAIVFGCADGLAVVTAEGDGFAARKVPYPGAGPMASAASAASTAPEPQALRVGTLAAHHDSDVLVGNYGDGLALITADGDSLAMDILPLPGAPLAFGYDMDGEAVAVLTNDGAMHAVDPDAGEITWTTPAVTPYADVEISDGFGFYPFIASSATATYVADAGTGEVLELDLESGEITNRFAIGGQPARVTLTQASGIVH